MTLQQELMKFRSEFLAKFPPEKAAIMSAATDALEIDLSRRDLLSVGDIAPDFSLPNASGEVVTLTELLQNGPVILTFYRGGWCPYCNLELRAYQQRLPAITSAGARLVAISPQAPDDSLNTSEKNNLEFDVLIDANLHIAQAYKLAFTLLDSLSALYDELGHSLPEINDEDDWRLPIPGTFVIDTNSTIALAFADADYRNRLEPDEAIDLVKRLQLKVAS